MRELAWIALLVGCKYTTPQGVGGGDGGPPPPDADEMIDASDPPPVDSSIDAPPSAGCFGDFAQVCLAALPGSDVNLNSGNNLILDTDASTLCEVLAEGTAVDACVLAGRNVKIDGTISARGLRPLVLLATTGTIQISSSAIVDVSSHVGRADPGAGARSACADNSSVAEGAGGGAGGSYDSKGGKGGDSATGNGGNSGDVAALAGLRGGCPGGDGGGTTGTRGQGGGAVALISTNTIIVDGTVNASGAGGEGAPFVAANIVPRGGGGGGAGGMIVIDCDDFILNSNAALIAQGGGGGEGSSAIDGGGDGEDPTTPGTNASGGSTNPMAGNGGVGATNNNGGAGDSGTATNGAGGGGGGKGFIVDSTTDGFVINGALSPPPVQAP